MKGVEVKTVCLYAIAWIAKKKTRKLKFNLPSQQLSVCMLVGFEFRGGVTHKYKFSITVS